MKYLPNQDNMKPVFATISLFILALVVSCSPAKQDSGRTQQVPALPQNQEQPAQVITETEQPSTEQNNAEVMLNPPHGEPHHRCDIPVGAPLDPPPATTTQQATEQNNAEVMLNPPHGEPHHRCDIPVGAPLNTQPATTARQSTVNPSVTAPTTANNPTAPTIENANRLSSSQPRSTTTTQNSGRINPPHGQPGHRCDIPVGSPLP